MRLFCVAPVAARFGGCGAGGERRQGRFTDGCCHGACYPCRRSECGAGWGKQGLGGVGKAAAPNPWQILRPHIEGCGPHVTKGSQLGGGWGSRAEFPVNVWSANKALVHFTRSSCCPAELVDTGRLRKSSRHNNHLPAASILFCKICIHRTTGRHPSAFFRFRCDRTLGRSRCLQALLFDLSYSHICIIR